MAPCCSVTIVSFYSHDKCCQDSASLPLGIIAFALIDAGKLCLDNIELLISV